MPFYTKEDLYNAISAVMGGVSRNQAAKQWGVPRSTLLGRLRGSNSKEQVNSDRQKLSPTEEISLAEWTRIQYILGLLPTYH